MVIVRLTGGLTTDKAEVLGMTCTCPGFQTQRAFAGSEEARQLKPTRPFQPP